MPEKLNVCTRLNGNSVYYDSVEVLAFDEVFLYYLFTDFYL